MPQTVEVRFKGLRRGFYLWPDDQDPLRLQDAVVVEADRGQDLGRVATTGDAAQRKCGGCTSCGVSKSTGSAAEASGESQEPGDAIAPASDAPEFPAPDPATAAGPAAPSSPLPAVLRRASPQEIGQANELRRAEDEVRRQAAARARQHQLDMRVSDAEWQWDRTRLTVYFTAERRVDFRSLVRELASQYRTRIELRQIGVRDEAARLGGVGRCGRAFCCSTWLKELSPVSLALAKDQHLSLNPAQISGGCGRLLCCLRYEHEFYVAARKRFPREGKAVPTARGTEKVVAVDIFRERVFLRHEEHGPRIIPLVQFMEEREAATAGGAVPGSVAPPAGTRPQAPPAPAARPAAPARPRPQPAPEPPQPRPQPAPASAESADQPRPPRRRSRRRRGRRGPGGGPPPPSGTGG